MFIIRFSLIQFFSKCFYFSLLYSFLNDVSVVIFFFSFALILVYSPFRVLLEMQYKCIQKYLENYWDTKKKIYVISYSKLVLARPIFESYPLKHLLSANYSMV